MGNICIKDTRCVICKKYFVCTGVKCIKCNTYFDIHCLQEYMEVIMNTKCPKCKSDKSLFYCDEDGSISYKNKPPIKL
jgi:hypothetical protein